MYIEWRNKLHIIDLYVEIKLFLDQKNFFACKNIAKIECINVNVYMIALKLNVRIAYIL